MDSLAALPHFELKYCERCAGLWLRPEGAITPYCPGCEHFMAKLPLRTLRHQPKPVRLASVVPVAISLLALLASWPAQTILGWWA